MKTLALATALLALTPTLATSQENTVAAIEAEIRLQEAFTNAAILEQCAYLGAGGVTYELADGVYDYAVSVLETAAIEAGMLPGHTFELSRAAADEADFAVEVWERFPDEARSQCLRVRQNTILRGWVQ